MKFVAELSKKEKEERRLAKKARLEAFRSLLLDPKLDISHKSKWTDAKARLSSDPRFEGLDDIERKTAFNEVTVRSVDREDTSWRRLMVALTHDDTA
jgi:hypothetical protein